MTFKQLQNELEGKAIPILLFSPNFKTGTPVTAMNYNRNKNILCFSYKEDHSHTGNEVLLSNMALNRAKGMRVPDDALITIDKAILGRNNQNIARYLAFNGDCSMVAINPKYAEDIVTELNARFDMAIETGMSDADMLQECFDDGFTIRDFYDVNVAAYEWAKKTKAGNGLVELRETVSI